jgi:hypothetical protein
MAKTKSKKNLVRRYTLDSEARRIARTLDDPLDKFKLRWAAKVVGLYAALCEEKEKEQTGIAWLERLAALEDPR